MREADTPAIVVRDLRFRYPKAAGDVLAIDRFEVARGEQVFVRGPSGCGKTTLLSLLAGVLLPGSGEVALSGQSWRGLSIAARDRRRADTVGYVFQQFNLLPYLSVLDNVLLPCRFSSARRTRAGGSEAAVRDSARRLLGRLGLSADMIRRDAASLSVGQQQRVAAARALVGGPSVVIADEPTSALDEGLREAFMAVFLEASVEAGSAVVFVSHDDRLARRFSRQVDLPRLNRVAAEPAALPVADTAAA